MKTNVVAFEGLMGLFGKWVERGLLSKLDLDKYSIQSYGWMSRGPKSLPPGPVIAVGHSFGGGVVMDWCERYGKPIDLLITLDPRVTGHKPYEKPSNVKRAVNFYQKGFMPGYTVEGATNVQVYSYSHTELPSMKRVYDEIMGG